MSGSNRLPTVTGRCCCPTKLRGRGWPDFSRRVSAGRSWCSSCWRECSSPDCSWPNGGRARYLRPGRGGDGSDGCGGLREAVRVRSQYGGVCRSAAAGTHLPHGGQLLKYRAAGKVFRIPEDVATCYGMTDSVYFILEPYIRIGREYALTPSPRREYREYVPQEPRMIVPRERFRIDTVSASYLASLGFSVRQAEAIVRYRDLYEGLRDEAGFRACYMIADSVADLLLPYVIFPEPEPFAPD